MPKILFINTYYENFLKDNPIDNSRSYFENMNSRILSRFGDSDFYSYWLRELGWDARDVIANDLPLQAQWANESGLEVMDKSKIWIHQIQQFSPNIVYFQDISMLNHEVAQLLRQSGVMICGQHASPMPTGFDFRDLDLFLSSMPHLVELGRSYGVKSVYMPLAFDHRLLKQVQFCDWSDRALGGFVGGYSGAHLNGVEYIIPALESNVNLQLFGYGWKTIEQQLLEKGIRWGGAIWGLEMFALLGGWKISLNRHIDMSGNHANNMRMYESTGMGALLLTDRKNKNSLFEAEKEIIEYDNLNDLVEKIDYFSNNLDVAEKIAKAGQLKTLEVNTYQVRMAQLSSELALFGGVGYT